MSDFKMFPSAIEEVVKRALVEGVMNRKRHGEKVLWVSELAYCPTLAYFSKLGLPGELDPGAAVRMHAGTGIHEGIAAGVASPAAIRDKYDEVRVVNRAEYPVVIDMVRGWVIHGRIDLLLPNYVPVEIKTMGRIPQEGPLRHHRDQLLLYIYGLRLEEHEVNYGFLVYIDRHRGLVKAFKVEYDEKRVMELLGAAELVVAKLEEMSGAPKPPGWVSEKDCLYCRYASTCPYARLLPE